MQASVRISAEPDPVPMAELDQTPRAPGSARANYDLVDDPGTLKAVLKAKDEKIATLEQRLEMSKEAMNGVKDRYKEKVETMGRARGFSAKKIADEVRTGQPSRPSS